MCLIFNGPQCSIGRLQYNVRRRWSVAGSDAVWRRRERKRIKNRKYTSINVRQLYRKSLRAYLVFGTQFTLLCFVCFNFINIQPQFRSPARSQTWNDLPEDVTSAESLTTFRRLLKTHLFRKCFPDYLLDINWLSPVDLAVVSLLRPPKNCLIDWLNFLTILIKDTNGKWQIWSMYADRLRGRE